MRWTRGMRPGSVVLAVVFVDIAQATPPKPSWPQWGGPNRDFVVDTGGLADAWPDSGPKKLWHRTLGTGYSSIAYDDGVLYTMYRMKKKDAFEFTIAIDAATGKTIWRKRHLAAIPKETLDYGKEFTGPNATPLIVGDRLFTAGRNANLRCFNKSDGNELWKQPLREKFGAELEVCGYSPSPLAYGETLILPLGRSETDPREGGSLIAFDQATGEVVWKAQTFRLNHSSPILIEFNGHDQLVLCAEEALLGADPSSGELLWRHPLDPEQGRGVFATPVWDGKDMLFFFSREFGYAVKLTASGDRTTASQLWSDNKVPLGMGTPVLVNGLLIGAKRGVNAAFMGVDARTGERLWLERLFPMATVIGDAGKLIILDHKGVLALASATREGLTVASQYQLTEQESFSAPTLVGTTLYVRDEKHIMALDVGQPSGSNGDEAS